MTRVLIIEDDPAMRVVMSRALTADGFDVLLAPDGGVGLSVFAREAPDAVVTDLHMPNVDGIETIIALRGQRPTLPIVAVSGGDSRASFLALDSAGDLGATVLLPKPFSPEQLCHAVRSALGTPRE